MRLEINEAAKEIRVTLSERNLRSLLAKLSGDPPNSLCTLTYFGDGHLMTVKAEPDDVHYANLERDTPTPGPMHPDTEATLKRGT